MFVANIVSFYVTVENVKDAFVRHSAQWKSIAVV